MIVRGGVKLREMGLKKTRSNLLPPPRVKFSLQSNFAVGDFHHGNRPFGVCSVFDVHVRTAFGKRALKNKNRLQMSVTAGCGTPGLDQVTTQGDIL
jgi:hypothetical protein